MSGGGSDEVEQTSTTAPWGPMQPYLKEGMRGAQQMYRQGGPGYYPGQTYVTPDPLQNYAQNLRLAYGMQSLPGQVGEARAAQSQMLTAPDVAQNPYVGGMADVISKRMARQFTEEMAPRIEGGAVAAGQLGSPGTDARMRRAMRGVSEATGDALAGLYGQAYGQGLEQQRAGLAMAPTTAQFGLMPMDVMGGVGDYRQAIAQQALQADMDRFGYQQQQPYTNVEWYLRQLGAGSPYSTSTGTTEQPGSSPLAGAVGGGLMGASLAPMAGKLAAGAGLGLSGGAMGPSAMLAGGMANPMMLPLMAGGALIGGLL